MRYSFSLEKIDYNNILTSAIQEELGKCLHLARLEKRYSLSKIPGIPVTTAMAIERNTGRHGWNTVKKVVNRYGYDARIGITFNVDVSLCERTQKQTK